MCRIKLESKKYLAIVTEKFSYNLHNQKTTQNFRMPSIYSYRFEDDGMEIIVHFVDRGSSDDTTEALSQVDSVSQRNWAIESIQMMREVNRFHWVNFPVRHNMECLFGKRLNEKNWSNSTAFLLHADNQISLYINRSYYMFKLSRV